MLKLALGIVLAVAAFAGVILIGNLSQPPTYPVAVVVAEVAPFSSLTPDQVQIDAQSLSAAVADKYVLADEWEAMVASGPVVAVEYLYPGQPLMREVLATGENALRVRRLSVALTDPELLPADHPLVTLPNCIVVPHIGSATVSTRTRMTASTRRRIRPHESHHRRFLTSLLAPVIIRA